MRLSVHQLLTLSMMEVMTMMMMMRQMRQTNGEKSVSGKGSSETSKTAGKEPVGNVRKRARVD
ncbi:unnamed protein product [Brassica oleracea]